MNQEGDKAKPHPRERSWLERGSGAAVADAAPGKGPTERDRSQDAPHFRILDDQDREADVDPTP